MRPFVALITAATVVVLTGCDTTTKGWHWPRYDNAETVVYFAVPDVANDIEIPVRDGILVWGQRVNRLETRIARTCPVFTNCVTVRFTEIPDNKWSGVTYVRLNGDHLVYGTRIDIDVSWARRGYWYARDTGCHEAGHALGLMHGQDGSLGPPCDGSGNPTAMDLALIWQLYGHREAT